MTLTCVSITYLGHKKVVATLLDQPNHIFMLQSPVTGQQLRSIVRSGLYIIIEVGDSTCTKKFLDVINQPPHSMYYKVQSVGRVTCGIWWLLNSPNWSARSIE